MPKITFVYIYVNMHVLIYIFLFKVKMCIDTNISKYTILMYARTQPINTWDLKQIDTPFLFRYVQAIICFHPYTDINFFISLRGYIYIHCHTFLYWPHSIDSMSAYGVHSFILRFRVILAHRWLHFGALESKFRCEPVGFCKTLWRTAGQVSTHRCEFTSSIFEILFSNRLWKCV